MNSLASLDNKEVREAANYHAKMALERSCLAMKVDQDLAAVGAITSKRDD